MSHKQSSLSSRSSSSENTFPFQHEDGQSHQTLIPEGILNDDDEDVSWQRSASRDNNDDKSVLLRVGKLPHDLTAREFAGLFLMADGFLSAELVLENDERIGFASFDKQTDAEKAKQKMSTVKTGPFARLSFQITSRRALDMPTPPATLSSSSKSTGSNVSMPQISRLASYVKEKSNDSQLGVDDFYGNPSSIPKTGNLACSVPSAYSTSAGTTVWSPTSPRFGSDMAKSPPNGMNMLSTSTSKDDESWNRSGTHNSAARMSQLNINSQSQSQDTRGQQTPMLSSHSGSGMIYASIDDSMHTHSNQRGPYTNPSQPVMYHASSPPKQHPTNNNYNNHSNTGVFSNNHRVGAPIQINTNPADQNPPCNTLYVGNLPLATTEEELKSLFSRQPGYRRLCYRTKSNGPMCFVEFEDVHFAINSLKLLQGVILSSSIKGGIRLSFSKNPLGVRKMDGGHSMANTTNNANAVPSSGHFNSMHAPPGLHSGQVHGHAHQQQQQSSISPIWR